MPAKSRNCLPGSFRADFFGVSSAICLNSGLKFLSYKEAGKKMVSELDVSKVKFVLFDWDNTLAESKTPLLFAIRQVIAEKNLPSWEALQSVRDHELSFKANFKNFFNGRADEVYERYAEVYLQNVKRLIRTFPKVPEVLRFLQGRGIKMMIMTNKDRRLLEYELPLLFEADFFERIVCGCEAPFDKPHKEQVFYTLRGYLQPKEITRSNVWVVGDSPQDSNAALASGALPIRIGNAIWEEFETRCGQVLYLKDFADFYGRLQEQN